MISLSSRSLCHETLAGIAGGLLLVLLAAATPAVAGDCRPLEPAAARIQDLHHDQGMLWQVTGHGHESSYVFGTMHVSDPEIVTLPDPVRKSLEQADRFVMEAELDGPEALQFAHDMFYQDGTRLSNLLSATLYSRVEDLLAAYGMPPAMIESLKPWAAFMTLNMPPANGVPLDIVLMQEAEANGLPVSGLEKLSEQAAVFENLPEATQVELLRDSICHYATLQQDMQEMKQLYLQRDLQALFNYQHKYRLHETARYQELLSRLLWDRNHTMVERMQPFLNKGNAFIAIGALHLPGEEGVLSLLEQAGYQVEAIY